MAPWVSCNQFLPKSWNLCHFYELPPAARLYVGTRLVASAARYCLSEYTLTASP